MLYTNELTRHGMDTHIDAQRCVRGTAHRPQPGLGEKRRHRHSERAPAIGRVDERAVTERSSGAAMPMRIVPTGEKDEKLQQRRGGRQRGRWRTGWQQRGGQQRGRRRTRWWRRSGHRVEREDAAMPVRIVSTSEKRQSSSAVAVGGLASTVVLRPCGKPRDEYAASGPSG